MCAKFVGWLFPRVVNHCLIPPQCKVSGPGAEEWDHVSAPDYPVPDEEERDGMPSPEQRWGHWSLIKHEDSHTFILSLGVFTATITATARKNFAIPRFYRHSLQNVWRDTIVVCLVVGEPQFEIQLQQLCVFFFLLHAWESVLHLIYTYQMWLTMQKYQNTNGSCFAGSVQLFPHTCQEKQ